MGSYSVNVGRAAPKWLHSNCARTLFAPAVSDDDIGPTNLLIGPHDYLLWDLAHVKRVNQNIKAPLLIQLADLDERVNTTWPEYEKALKANKNTC